MMSEDVKLIPAEPDGNPAPWKKATEEAREDFLRRLEIHGLTVIPSYQKKWWKTG